MRAIFGLTALDGGEVRWEGRPIDAAARRAFGYLPEERGLYPTMRVGDQLRYLGQLRGLDKAEAAAGPTPGSSASTSATGSAATSRTSRSATSNASS